MILHRTWDLTGQEPVLAGSGETFEAVAKARGVPLNQAVNPKQQDSRAIKHNGPNAHYGPRKKAS